MIDPPTVATLLERAMTAYDDLQVVGEAVDDEWGYINDLGDAWRARLGEVVEQRGADAAGASVVTAIDTAIDEIVRIEDPHRAIDWLSTYPQVVLAALGEPA